MNDVESVIRRALLKQADAAPPPGPVLAALHRRRRSRKPLFVVLVAAAAAVAAAVVATTVPRQAADTPPGGSSVSPPPPAVITGTGTRSTPIGLSVDLEYSPGWLPDGFREWSRVVNDKSGLRRVWRGGDPRQKVGPRITLRVHVQDAAHQAGLLAAAPAAQRTDVNGAPAYVDDENVLFWQVSPERVLSVVVDDQSDARALALRIAESVKPDTTAWPVPVSLDESTEATIEVESGDDWVASGTGAHDGVRYAFALLTRDPGTSPSGKAVTALGRDAVYVAASGGFLVVKLESGRYLGIGSDGATANRATATVEQLTAALEQLRFDPDPKVDWAR